MAVVHRLHMVQFSTESFTDFRALRNHSGDNV
jgi:hypothetical protein